MKKAMDIFITVIAILFVINFISNGNESTKEDKTSKLYGSISVTVEWDKKAESYYLTSYVIDDQKVICNTRFNSSELYEELQKMASASDEVNITMKCGATVPTPSNVIYTYVN